VETQSYRYERKFVVNQSRIAGLFTLLKHGVLGFAEAYPERKINSIYFDDLALTQCAENIDGIGKRTKIRVRWYGDNKGMVVNPKLEFKIKSALVGRKEIFHVNTFDANGSTRDIVKALLASDLPQDVKLRLRTTSPVVQVSYWRKYFESRDGRYRLTFDDRIRYFNAGNGVVRGAGNRDDRNIVELKYDVDNDVEVERITNRFPFRLSKNSKYVNAIQSIYRLKV